MKKFLSVFLAMMLLLGCCPQVYAATTMTGVISDMHDFVVEMYDKAESAPQQTSAAAVGSMFMLNIIVQEMCSSTRCQTISDLITRLSEQIDKVDGAPQASALSLSGCVYALGAIAYEKDYSGRYSDIIKSTLDNLTEAETSSAVQEMALGSYRMVDMLEIIALEEGVSSTTVFAIEDLLSENNAKLDGAPQQTTNGLYRSAELLYYIAQRTCSSYYASKISDYLDGMYADDDTCSSAVQQTANGMTTVYLMLNAIAQDNA